MKVEIITIGDEILIGQIVDTNSAWMAQALGDIGIRVHQISSISDQEAHIFKALVEAEGRVEVIIMTGGLGPTKDDITKHSLAKYFGVGMKQDKEALENVTSIFARFNMPLLEVNKNQAMVPENCQVLQNLKGTAPGMWFEERGKIYISLPGVPHEMKGLMESEVIPKLLEKGNLPALVHQTLLTAGIGESFLAQKLEPIEEALPRHIKLAYLPKLGQVRLRLTAFGASKPELEKEVEGFTQKIMEIVSDHLIWKGDGTLSQAILARLESLKKTFATAESCTGGYIAREITSVPGASKSYLGGLVPYSNALKIQLLGVKEETLTKFGAVSEETVREMVKGLLERIGADFGIATSGIAGPDGGTKDKPVGIVWVAWGGKGIIQAKKFQFGKDRLVNIERSATVALTQFLTFLKEVPLE